jgi:hemolysin activation/secretion protein
LEVNLLRKIGMNMKIAAKRILQISGICIAFIALTALAIEPTQMYGPTETRTKLEEQKRLEQEARQRIEVSKNAMTEAEAALVTLPRDTTPKWSISEIQISGNNLISTAELLKGLPLIYNSSSLPLNKAPSDKLYDFKILRDVIANPGQPREISGRTIKGFTEYLLSEYTSRNYAGIYVYVPAEAMQPGKAPAQGVLPVQIIEASVSKVTVKSYDVARKEKEKGYLRHSAIEAWSPAEPNKVINEKKLNDFVNLLNLNPDRYVSAVISKGAEPNTLAVRYDIIETDPWHWFAQIDNSGVKERQWAPRVGVINTDLFGFDDIFTVVYQARPDSTFEENYSVYGSYDFPLLGPRLRLNLYGGYGHFDMSPPGNVEFIGTGSFYGGQLRYNLFQADKWFFDVLGGFSQEDSKTSPQIPPFTSLLETQQRMDLVDYGFDLHRRNDMTETSIVFERTQNVGGSSREDFTNSRLGGAAKYFAYDTLAVSHKQYLDPNKVNNLIGTFKAVYPEDRLPPAKMTPFGGMYTVRGYAEDGIVADGGILASLQYEFDLVKYNEAKSGRQNINQPTNEQKPWLRRLAPLAFADYGWAKIKDPVSGENSDEILLSAGPGLTADIGEHFTAVLYWGIALQSTTETDAGQSQVNVGLLVRW